MNTNKANNVLIFSASQVVSLLINFLVSPYLSRALPKSDYSIYNQVIVILSLTGVLFSAGIQSVVFFFLSRNDENKRKIVTTIQFLLLILAAVSVFGIFGFSYFAHLLFDSQFIGDYIRICSFATFVTFINNYLISLLIYNNKARYVAGMTVISSVFSVTFIYVSLNFWHSIKWALLFSQVLAPLLSAVLAFWAVKGVFIRSVRPDSGAVRSVLKVSLPLYFTTLLGSSYIYVTSFFVIFILGDIDYANYRNGAVEIPFISTVAFSISSVLLPDLNKYFHSGNKIAALELKKKIINQCIFLLYPVIIFFIVFSHEFIVAYFSQKYAESAVVFAIFSFTCFVRVNDYFDVLITSGNTPYILKANILYFLSNIALVFLLGYLWGVNGVAAAASISVFILALVLLKKDAEIFGIKITDFFRGRIIIEIMVLASGLSLILKLALTYFVHLKPIYIFLIASILYFPVIYLYILYKGYVIDSIVQIVRKRVPFISFFLSKPKHAS